MRLFELAYCCRLYGEISRFDASIERLRRISLSGLDLATVSDNRALLVWLNSWGCRQFDKAHHSEASRMLVRWGKNWLPRLPARDSNLAALDRATLERVADVYEDLCRQRAGFRRRSNGAESIVSVGPTGAAKILYAVRPSCLPPWDDPIREALQCDKTRMGYLKFLEQVRQEIAEVEREAKALGIASQSIPKLLGRPQSSFPKLIDEYYWVTVTQRHQPPPKEELARWTKWSRVS